MRKIIIDTDPGIDDAIAIFLALAAKDSLEILGITTVNGNVGLEQVTKNACKILKIAGEKDIPVYKGHGKPLFREREHCEEFHGDDGLGNIDYEEENNIMIHTGAVEFLIERARKEKGELTILAIGPLTNIADAVQKNMKFVDNVKELVIMGGAENGGNMSPHAEFNFWTDPEAAKIVFEAGFSKITMIGLDATSYVFLSPSLRELIYLINTPISKVIHKMTRVYADGHWLLEKKMGCELCDVLAVAYLLNENVVETVEAFVDIETQGLCDGASVVYRNKFYPDKKVNCNVAIKADTKLFFETYFKYQFPDYIECMREAL